MSWTVVVISASLVIAGFLVCGALAKVVAMDATEHYIRKRMEKHGIVEQPVDYEKSTPIYWLWGEKDGIEEQQADYEKPTYTDLLWAAGLSVVVLLYVGAFIWAVL